MLQNKLTVSEAKLHEINEKCVTQANFLRNSSWSVSSWAPMWSSKNLEQKLQAANGQVQDFEEKYNTVINYYKTRCDASKNCSLKNDLKSPGANESLKFAKLVKKDDDLIGFIPTHIHARENLNDCNWVLSLWCTQITLIHPLSRQKEGKEGIKRGLWDINFKPNTKILLTISMRNLNL